MSDVFIGYVREDRPRAESLAHELESKNFTVFWDELIAIGQDFREVIEEEIAKAKCAIVLWSRNSVRKDWVIDEAERASKNETYLPVVLESDLQLPMGLRGSQWIDLSGWNDQTHPSLEVLIRRVSSMIQTPRPPVAVAKPMPGELITDEHLVLIHSSERRPEEDDKHGGRMYQIYVIVYCHAAVLEQIEQVEYFLDPSYPQNYYVETDASKNFRLKELANGYSVVRAKVKLRGQGRKVELSRFINLTETATDLRPFFGGRKDSGAL